MAFVETPGVAKVSASQARTSLSRCVVKTCADHTPRIRRYNGVGRLFLSSAALTTLPKFSFALASGIAVSPNRITHSYPIRRIARPASQRMLVIMQGPYATLSGARFSQIARFRPGPVVLRGSSAQRMNR
jgi:hypothetical protein